MGGGRWGQRQLLTTTGLRGGRENADDFAGYVDEDNDDDPIGGRGGAVAPERRRGRRMEKKEEEEDDDKGMASGDNDSGEGKDGKGGQSRTRFLGLRWHGMTAGQRKHQQRHTTIK